MGAFDLQPDFSQSGNSGQSAQLSTLGSSGGMGNDFANSGGYGNTQNVLGASTQNPQGFTPPSQTTSQPGNIPSGGNTQGNSQQGFQQQWEQAGHQGTAPVGYHGESTGNPSGIDYNAMIAPVLQGYQDLISQMQGSEAGQETQYNQQAATQQQGAWDTTNAALNTLGTQATNTTNAAGNAVEDAKRMYSEMSQGILARYGSSTNTGGFLTEQLGQSTGRNIAQLQQGLATNIQAINNKKNEVQAAGAQAIQGIRDKFDQMIQTSKSDLMGFITKIQGDADMLQAQKAQMIGQSIQKFQDYTNSLNLQHNQLVAQEQTALLNAQTQLETWGKTAQGSLLQTMQGMQNSIGTPNFQGQSQANMYGPGSIGNSVTGQQPATPQDTGSLVGANRNPFAAATGGQ